MKDDFSAEEIEKIERNNNEEKQFRKNIRKILKGSNDFNGSRLIVGDTPNIISITSEFGDLNLLISKKVIEKCISPLILDDNGRRKKHSGHSLTVSKICDVIWSMKRPILVMRGSVDNSLAIMTDIRDENDNYIFVYIGLNQLDGFKRANLITSMYGKSGLKDYLESNILKGNILAVDKEKVDELSRSIGVDFPEETSYINFDCRIAYSLNHVNNQGK